MPVLLASRRIPRTAELAALLPDGLSNSSVAVIPNGRDGLNEADRRAKLRETVAYLRGLLARTVVLDLRDVDEARVEQALSRTQWCWVMGGDPVLLCRAMITSGFADVVNRLVSVGYVYAGESAGAVVAGVSLKGFDDGDDQMSVDRPGLGLVPMVVLPHADNPDFADASQRVRSANRTERFLMIDEADQYVFLGAAVYDSAAASPRHAI